MKIKSKAFIKGELKTYTGLHIGGNSGGLRIGGADSVVIRSAINNQPYIPGSSLRGKMRSLLERSRGEEESDKGGYSKTDQNGYKAGTNPNTLLGKLFGTGVDDKEKESKKTPTRLIVRDAFLTEDSSKILENASNTDMPMTEVKTEVVIDRITSKAMPREIERVPAGVIFNIEFILTLYEKDDEKKFLELLFESLDLIEGDSLGGHGSRGYGQVRFKNFKKKIKSIEDYKNLEEGKEDNSNIPDKFKNNFDKTS